MTTVMSSADAPSVTSALIANTTQSMRSAVTVFFVSWYELRMTMPMTAAPTP
jgi:hypothetical protein